MQTAPAQQDVSLDAQIAAVRAERKQLQTASDNPKLPSTAPVTSTGTQQKPKEWWTTQDAMTVSTVILVFGAIVVGIAAFLIRKETDGQVILKVLATILIITFSVFLIVAGWSDQQIGPAMGLLGTIAGYLLGKDTRAPVSPEKKVG